MRKNILFATTALTLTATSCANPFGGEKSDETLAPLSTLSPAEAEALLPTTVATTEAPASPIVPEYVFDDGSEDPTETTAPSAPTVATTLPIVIIPLDEAPAIPSNEQPDSPLPSEQNEPDYVQFVFEGDGNTYNCIPASVNPDSSNPNHATQTGFIADVHGYPLSAGFGSAALAAALQKPDLFAGIETYTPTDGQADIIPYCDVA